MAETSSTEQPQMSAGDLKTENEARMKREAEHAAKLKANSHVREEDAFNDQLLAAESYIRGDFKCRCVKGKWSVEGFAFDDGEEPYLVQHRFATWEKTRDFLRLKGSCLGYHTYSDSAATFNVAYRDVLVVRINVTRPIPDKVGTKRNTAIDTAHPGD